MRGGTFRRKIKEPLRQNETIQENKMQFKDAQKQAEFDAFKTYCETVAKRPFSAVKRTLMSTIQSVAAGQYGAEAAKEISAIFRTLTPAPKGAEPGKMRGEGRKRHSPTPEAQMSPEMQALFQRRAQRAGQGSRSEASAPVAVDNPAHIIADGMIPDGTMFAKFEVSDSGDSGIKESYYVVEYTREEIIDFLTSQGVEVDFEGKTDRQLKNLVKKHSA